MPVRINNKNLKMASAMQRAGIKSSSFCGSGGGYGSAGGGSIGGSSGMGGTPGRGGSGNFNKSMYNPVFDNLDEGTVIEYWLPRDPARIHAIFRRVYMLDPVAGPALELYKDLPFSDFQLTGVRDTSILNLYADAFNAIDIVSKIPDMALEYMKLGKVIGHMHMNESKGYPTHLEIHDPDHIRMMPSPISGMPGKLDLVPTKELKEWATSKDPRDTEVQAQYASYVALIREGGTIPLDSSNSFYIPRRTSPYDPVGASIYTRILLFVAYEKAIVNASVTSARRRMGKIRHVTAGMDDSWVPDEQELSDIADLFTNADEDPTGAIVVTRDGVTVSEVGGDSLQDMVKISDEWEFLTKGKLNSLGISETFLTGEATYNTIEQLMSVFLDKIRSLRSFFTQSILISEILRPLADKHGFYKTTEARLSHRIRIAESSDSNEYILPDIVWEKNLRPVADRDWMEILEQMQNAGIPITIRTVSSAAGFDVETEIAQFDEDIELRRKLKKQMDEIEKIESDAMDMGSDDSGDDFGDDFGGDLDLDMDEDLGGPSEAPEAPEEPLTLPTVETAASSKVPVIDNLYRLPHFGKGRKSKFMGLSFEQVELAAHRILHSLGNKKNRLGSSNSIRGKYLRFGSEKKAAAAEYILSRSGLLLGTKYDKDFANEVMDALISAIPNKKELTTELAFLHSRMNLADTRMPRLSSAAQVPEFNKEILRRSNFSQSSLLDKSLLIGSGNMSRKF